mgnify:CR=1 FL=1
MCARSSSSVASTPSKKNKKLRGIGLANYLEITSGAPLTMPPVLRDFGTARLLGLPYSIIVAVVFIALVAVLTNYSAAGRRFVAAASGSQRFAARACVLAAGGFESNREWLREAWGRDERGEWPADNFLIRGTRFNQGVLLRQMIDAEIGRAHV